MYRRPQKISVDLWQIHPQQTGLSHEWEASEFRDECFKTMESALMKQTYLSHCFSSKGNGSVVGLGIELKCWFFKVRPTVTSTQQEGSLDLENIRGADLKDYVTHFFWGGAI